MTRFYRNFKLIMLAALLLGLNACKKEQPEKELPQEEFKSVIFQFIELEAHGDHFHEHADTVKIEFGADGNATGSHYDLHAGTSYRLKVVAYDFVGREMQNEFVQDASAHQLFITGAQDGVLNYVYEDENVGVTGRLDVLKPSEGSMILNAVLRHGLDKTKATAADWNNPNHADFGGSADFSLRFPLHAIEGDHDDHDHDH
ncbi:MAG: hypothetical protein INR69_16485 [Mucilaginibacter polytrichastri]|nr:hypothetical protein [Mucilaginibacter polytrichastri]